MRDGSHQGELIPEPVSLTSSMAGINRGVKLNIVLRFATGVPPAESIPFPRVSSEMSDPDRRRAQRIDLKQDASLVIGDGGLVIAAITENFSSAGVLLYADQLIQDGSEIGLVLVVPPTESEAKGRRMWCLGRVVRVEKQLKEKRFGLAIALQRFEELSHA